MEQSYAKLKNCLQGILAGCLLISACSSGTAPDKDTGAIARKADLVFTNANVHTINKDSSTAEVLLTMLNGREIYKAD
ncbi:MAG: hypothetical protein U9P00_13575 [Pseudomonadota bacterium]|nr:hypothetical protein [Pseudomonadota bacterium]